jgi:LAO/AO transport system kinase
MTQTNPQPPLAELIEAAFQGEKYALARLISLVERRDTPQFRGEIFSQLESYPKKGNTTIGITGSPGAGKSSLIGEICKEFLSYSSTERMAVIAIDPSSAVSGGSVLGDRTRVILPAREKRIFFRSQASQLELGGVNPHTYHVLRLLRFFFELVLIETVGIGQNEIEVSKLSDHSVLVLQPLGGDQVQFMKSGIMEVPQTFIINKCDETELAQSSYHLLLNSLEFLQEILEDKRSFPKIFLTSVPKKKGIEELCQFLFSLPRITHRPEEMKLQLQKWAKNEYGIQGLAYLERLFPQSFRWFEEGELQFRNTMSQLFQ